MFGCLLHSKCIHIQSYAVFLQEMMMAALAFRNKYASRPYLPEELIPAGHKKVLKSNDFPVLKSCFGNGISIFAFPPAAFFQH